MDPRQHLLRGKQIGLLIDGQGNGLRIQVTGDGQGVQWQKVINHELQPIMDHQICSVKDVYDSRQGSYVSGFELLDVRGVPTGEIYRMNQFQMEGNITYGGGTAINNYY